MSSFSTSLTESETAALGQNMLHMRTLLDELSRAHEQETGNPVLAQSLAWMLRQYDELRKKVDEQRKKFDDQSQELATLRIKEQKSSA